MYLTIESHHWQESFRYSQLLWIRLPYTIPHHLNAKTNIYNENKFRVTLCLIIEHIKSCKAKSISFLTVHSVSWDTTQHSTIPSQHIRNPQQFHSTSLTTNIWLLIMTSLNKTYHITQVIHRSSLHRTMLSWFTGNSFSQRHVLMVCMTTKTPRHLQISFHQSNSDSGMLQQTFLGEKRTWPAATCSKRLRIPISGAVLCQRIVNRRDKLFVWQSFLVRRTNSCPENHSCWPSFVGRYGLACAYIWSSKHEMKHAARVCVPRIVPSYTRRSCKRYAD